MSTPATPLSPEHPATPSNAVALPPYAAPGVGDRAGAAGHTAPRSVSGPYVPAAWRTEHRPPVAHTIEAPIAASPYRTPVGLESLFGADEAPDVPAAFRESLETERAPAEDLRGMGADSDLSGRAGPSDAEQGTSSESLPWIDAFLAETPAMGVPSIGADQQVEKVEQVANQMANQIAEHGQERGQVAPQPLHDPAVPDAPVVAPEEPSRPMSRAERIASLFTPTASLTVPQPPTAEAPEPAADAPMAADEWPLADAATALDAMARQIGALGPVTPNDAGRGTPKGMESAPLSVWSDDDMVDIMPMSNRLFTPRHPVAPPNMPSGAEEPVQRDPGAEAAAHALEILARRVRAGELPLAGYEPRMGDAAALVAALAALLGVKLR